MASVLRLGPSVSKHIQTHGLRTWRKRWKQLFPSHFKPPATPAPLRPRKRPQNHTPSLSSFLIFPFPLLGKGKGPKTPGGG